MFCRVNQSNGKNYFQDRGIYPGKERNMRAFRQDKKISLGNLSNSMYCYQDKNSGFYHYIESIHVYIPQKFTAHCRIT